MSRAETRAVLALLETGELEGRVHLGSPPDGTLPPFVVVWPAPGDDWAEQETGGETTSDVSHIVHAAGETVDQALLVADWVDARMRGGWMVVPVVPGRSCDVIRRTLTPLASRDDAARPPVHVVTQEFSFISRPGGTS